MRDGCQHDEYEKSDTSDHIQSPRDRTRLLHLFVEIAPADDTDHSPPPDLAPAVVSIVAPKYCGRLLKELSALLPLRRRGDAVNDDGDASSIGSLELDLSHLKRVRRQRAVVFPAMAGPLLRAEEVRETADKTSQVQNDGDQKSCASSITSETDPPPRKRLRGKKKKDRSLGDNDKDDDGFVLEVVLGSAKDVDRLDSQILNRLIDDYNLNLETRDLPGRPAQSKEELQRWNSIWPTIYFHKKTEEHRRMVMALTDDEVELMGMGMEEAVADAKGAERQWAEWFSKRDGPSDEWVAPKDACDGSRSPLKPLGGAVIMDPRSKKIISRSSDERKRQMDQFKCDFFLDEANPLCTPVLLAIQGVSRLERARAGCTSRLEGMTSEEFKNGQYLCTGYDLYTTVEPGIFESMALVHSRIRRVTFGVMDATGGGLGGTGQCNAVHTLPGTNHRYRVFRCNAAELDNGDEHPQNHWLRSCYQLYPR